MPIRDGAEATRKILAEMPEIVIIALSIYTDEGFMAGMIRTGALGYIPQGCDCEELLAAIRRATCPRRPYWVLRLLHQFYRKSSVSPEYITCGLVGERGGLTR